VLFQSHPLIPPSLPPSLPPSPSGIGDGDLPLRLPLLLLALLLLVLVVVFFSLRRVSGSREEGEEEGLTGLRLLLLLRVVRVREGGGEGEEPVGERLQRERGREGRNWPRVSLEPQSRQQAPIIQGGMSDTERCYLHSVPPSLSPSHLEPPRVSRLALLVMGRRPLRLSRSVCVCVFE